MDHVVDQRFRIIPAHAGSTNRAAKRGINYRDHPRTCGEHPINYLGKTDAQGSSPHMRGAPPVSPSGRQK